MAESYGNYMLNTLRNCFPKQLCHFTFPSAVCLGSSSSASLSRLIILFDKSHLYGCDVVSQCVI